MVTLLPSTATKSITVLEREIGTTLTITAPSEVLEGGAFGISGYLTRDDTAAGIPDATVTLRYNETLLGSDTTSVEGHYLLTGCIIPSIGTFTLEASFAGMTGLAASQASKGISIRGLEILDPIWAIASAALGVVLVMLGYSK